MARHVGSYSNSNSEDDVTRGSGFKLRAPVQLDWRDASFPQKLGSTHGTSMFNRRDHLTGSLGEHTGKGLEEKVKFESVDNVVSRCQIHPYILQA